jgi:N-acetylneuraminate synthase
MIDARSPGKGLQPDRRKDLIGKAAVRDLKPGDFFFPTDLGIGIVKPRKYKFTRPFGIPVRYHDYARISKCSNFDLIEFHLSYKDMDLDISKFIHEPQDFDLVVHAPELFEGDHILDLCSPDETYRMRSLKEMQRVINVTRALKHYFPKTEKPCIITNVGGFNQTGFINSKERDNGYKTLKRSLSELDMEGIDVIPQTMPPYPWHFGGQSYHNLFVQAEEIAEFCEYNDYRVCLDVSHSKLACTYYRYSFDKFLRIVAPYSAHMHIVDAKGIDGEGLQIGEGEINFNELSEILTDVSPAASFIPEIWQGHKDEGTGFWTALDRLEKAGL